MATRWSSGDPGLTPSVRMLIERVSTYRADVASEVALSVQKKQPVAPHCRASRHEGCLDTNPETESADVSPSK